MHRPIVLRLASAIMAIQALIMTTMFFAFGEDDAAGPSLVFGVSSLLTMVCAKIFERLDERGRDE